MLASELVSPLLWVDAMASVQSRQLNERRADGRRRWLGGLDGAVVAVLVALAVVATGEITTRRSATSAATERDSSWQAVLRVGDEARERGDMASARRAYLTALFRARGERSFAGVLSAAEGFGTLGDGEVVERALQMAVALDPSAEPLGAMRLEALRDRLAIRDVSKVHATP
jgi:hypothetical protein